MPRKKILLVILFLSALLPARAQHQEINEKPGLWKEKETDADTSSLLAAFRRGKASGHFRYFFMATQNRGELSDYYANALGGGIKLETARFRNFQLGVSGFFVFNIGSSNLAVPDSFTKQPNRYEIGLFDIEEPDNKKDIDRLEELYLKYHFKKATLSLGKQLINTPFINLQDGRMRPTEVEGIWAESQGQKNTRIRLGILWGISPRSTVKWYNIGESIGIYPGGVNEEGARSAYAGQLRSKGILLTGISHTFHKHLQLQVWNQFTENIFNSALLQADYEYPLSKTGSSILASGQLIRQDAVHQGGNADPSKTYVTKGARAWTFGGRLGWKNERWETSLNYNRITAHGRYLMPREWGRDPFFTFLPRERNEGLGDVHAIVAKLNYKIPKARMQASLALGNYRLPAVEDFALNKYGLPSYRQVNIDLRYRFSGLLKGLETQLLFVRKSKTGNSHDSDKYVINKVDMNNWNLLFNYAF